MSNQHLNLQKQSGFVLIVSLIMLIVITLVGISVIRISTTNLQLVNNMQARQQAIAGATDVINQVLSSSFINEVDMNAGLNAVSNASYSFSPQGTGGTTYSVTMSKPCLKSITPLKNAEINALIAINSNYQTCLAQGFWSSCYRSLWQVTATVSTGFLGARMDVTQGTEVILSQAAGISAGSATTAYYCAS